MAVTRHPEDSDDRAVGDALAIGMALERLGIKIHHHAMGVVKHRDDVRQARATRRAHVVAVLQVALGRVPTEEEIKESWLRVLAIPPFQKNVPAGTPTGRK